LSFGLQRAIEAWSPAGNDDSFDAVVGLMGMIEICLGQRKAIAQDNESVLRV
jgi:cadmium resistance protein CadD (predicted permease)